MNRLNLIHRIFVLFVFVLSMVFYPSNYAKAIDTLSLHVFATTMTQIVLRWGDPFSDTVSYVIQRDTSSEFENPVVYTISEDSANFKFKIFSDTNPATNLYDIGADEWYPVAG